MVDQEVWTKVITDPLGFAGFALFLVFLFVGYSRRKSSQTEKPSSFSVFEVMAFTALVGGLLLSYQQNKPAPDENGGSGGGDTIQIEIHGNGTGVGKNEGVINVNPTPQGSSDSSASGAPADPAQASTEKSE